MLELRMADMAIGSREQSEQLQESISATHQSMKRTIDTQTFIVSLATRGTKEETDRALRSRALPHTSSAMRKAVLHVYVYLSSPLDP